MTLDLCFSYISEANFPKICIIESCILAYILLKQINPFSLEKIVNGPTQGMNTRRD